MGRSRVLGLLLLALPPLLGGCPPDRSADRGVEPTLGLVDRTWEAGIEFENHTGRSGRKDYLVEAKGGGVLCLDHDGDGDVDLYFVDGNRLELDGEGVLRTRTADPEAGNRLYRNEGGLSFTDVTEEAGVGDRSFGVAGTVGDYDNDGDPDLFVCNWGPNVLYRNEGDGTFTDATAAAGVAGAADLFSTCAAFLDADGDGFLDLYVANCCELEGVMRESGPAPARPHPDGAWVFAGPHAYPPRADLFYRNRGDGTFEDRTASALPDQRPAYGFQPVPFDADGDGDTDLYVANDRVPNFLWLNDGRGRFREVAAEAGAATDEAGAAQASTGACAGDFDRDGRMDLVVTGFAPDCNTLYRNLSSGGRLRFEAATATAGLSLASFRKVSWGIGLVDFDLDGFLDLFVSNGHVYPPSRAGGTHLGSTYEQTPDLLLSTGPPAWRFRDVTRAAGPGLRVARSGRAAAFADLDDDGDPDVVVACLNQEPLLLENRLPRRGGWLQLALEGRASNRDGIGARVTLVTGGGGVRQVADHALATSFGATRDPRLLFGLGKAARADRLEVRWPSGLVQTFTDVPGNRRYRLVEGEEALREAAAPARAR